jgi:predicted  nucleic acid-binding Zn-ribbon protein
MGRLTNYLTELFISKRSQISKEPSTWNLAKSGCPDCGEKKFYFGPEGGACVNICCSNALCRSAFNDLGMGMLIHRIPNSSFRSAFPACPDESEAYLRTEIKTQLDKESEQLWQ